MNDFMWGMAVQAQQAVDATRSASPGNAVNPFDQFTGRVLGTGILAFALFLILIAGGILILNLGLLSKRKEDRTGGRTPSDVAILKENVWPEAPYEEKSFPALEDEEEGTGEALPSNVTRIRKVQEISAAIRARRIRNEARRLQQVESGEEGPPGIRVMHSQTGSPVIEHGIPPMRAVDE